MHAEQTKPRPIPEPGIYKNIPFDAYCTWDAVNVSSLKPAMRSWRHYQMALYEERKPSPAMQIGRLLHSLRFEPRKLLNEYVVMPDFVKEIEAEYPGKWKSIRGTKEYENRVKAWRSDNTDKTEVTAEWMEQVQGMDMALSTHPRACEYLATPAESELSVVWRDPETDLLCKIRIDHAQHQHQRITDLKSIDDATRAEQQIKKLLYHVQGAFYTDGMMYATGGELYQFCFVFVESSPPFGVRAAPLSELAIDEGRKIYRRLLNELAECRASDHWPIYEDPDEWNLPGMGNNVTLKVQGEKVTL